MKTVRIQQTLTDRTEQSVDQYFNSVAKQSPVLPEEEKELAERIHNGDQKAFERLVCGNLRFVISIAKQFQNQGVSLADLIEEGNLGLMKAASKFDAKKDNKFISYAVFWIMDAIQRAIQTNGRLIRFPRRLQGIANSIRDFQKKYEAEAGMPASPEEIAAAVGTDEQTVLDIINTDVKGSSLDRYLYDDSDETVDSKTPQNLYEEPDYEVSVGSAVEQLDIAMHATLKERDIYIIRQHYGLDGERKSAQQLGLELGLSRERVRQIINDGLAKLRQSRYSDELRMCC